MQSRKKNQRTNQKLCVLIYHTFFTLPLPIALRGAAKKSSFLYGRAFKRGGAKGRQLRKNNFFSDFYSFFLLPFKYWNHFTLDNLLKYGHITLKFIGRYFYWVVTIFSKNRAILVQKLREENELSKSVSGYFMTKKKSYWH